MFGFQPCVGIGAWFSVVGLFGLRGVCSGDVSVVLFERATCGWGGYKMNVRWLICLMGVVRLVVVYGGTMSGVRYDLLGMIGGSI